VRPYSKINPSQKRACEVAQGVGPKNPEISLCIYGQLIFNKVTLKRHEDQGME
jgi:hypothetical protein